MTTKQTKELLNICKLNFNEFQKWMIGQTVSIKDGETCYYAEDISRYIDMKTKGIPTYFD